MMMDKVFLILSFVILILERKLIPVVSGAGENGGGDGDIAGGVCGVNLAGFLPLPYSNLPNMVCKPVWNSYIIRVSSLIFFMHSSCVQRRSHL